MNTVTVPLFPLPGLVLFPRTMLPLHIFEPRYIKLVKDCLAGNRRIATGHLRKGWEKDYHGAPQVFRAITIARILYDDTLEGGRYNILLEGIERAEVVEEVQKTPYRLVKARPLVEMHGDGERGLIATARRELLALCGRLAELRPDLRNVLNNLENTHLHPGIMADQVAAALVRDGYERQSLLEESRVLRRLELVNVQLRLHLADLEGTRAPQHDPS